jgi:hypothetical protein
MTFKQKLINAWLWRGPLGRCVLRFERYLEEK